MKITLNSSHNIKTNCFVGGDFNVDLLDANPCTETYTELNDRTKTFSL